MNGWSSTINTSLLIKNKKEKNDKKKENPQEILPKLLRTSLVESHSEAGENKGFPGRDV